MKTPKTEFRGVWIATVVNIDWPRNSVDRWQKQQADYLEFLKFYKQLNFNAVIVQVRTAGDAFYLSEHAPWSRFLTAKEGLPPKTDEDPLKWLINTTHRYGFEFHAWINPYRATFDLNTDILSPEHDFFQHPEWMVKYGKKYYYNPGLPEVRQKLELVVDELISKYPIDAIHFDDYFYPYKIAGEVFEDSTTYKNQASAGQTLEDWRRSNVDSLVAGIHRRIKIKKPWVQLGISPFGVWKNNSTDPRGSETKAGQTTYEDLYADPLLWMEKGWIDYLIPQLYWSRKLEVASHKKLLDWWSNTVVNTNLYIGNGAYKIRNNSDKAWNRKKELPKQLQLARASPKVKGNAFFSAKSLLTGKKDIVSLLKERVYHQPVLPPASPLTKESPISTPRLLNISEEDNFYRLNFEIKYPEDYQYVILYGSRKRRRLSQPGPGQMLAKIYLNGRVGFNLGKGLAVKNKHLAVSFVDRYRRETEPLRIHLNQTNSNDTKK